MKPTTFPEENTVFKGPKDSDIIPLPVCQDKEEIISCWRLGWKERLSALVFGTVWLSVLGSSQPAVSLLASKDFFLRKNFLLACGHCYGNGFNPGARSYKGNGVNINVSCPYCKGSGLNRLGKFLRDRKEAIG